MVSDPQGDPDYAIAMTEAHPLDRPREPRLWLGSHSRGCVDSGPRFCVFCSSVGPLARSELEVLTPRGEVSVFSSEPYDILSDLELDIVPFKGLISTSVKRADYIY